MSLSSPPVSIVIAARLAQREVAAVAFAQRLEYPPECLEIIVARGSQPSAQRNAAVREAKGEWIYFLDDDSLPAPGNLRTAARHFSQPAVRVIGGPNLCPPDAPEWELIFAEVMGHRLAFGPSRARYRAVGPARLTSEKELILCNLLMHRQAYLEAGGLNEALYPNEENALMDTIHDRGGQLIYDPEFSVYRRPRPTPRSFLRMLIHYGRGRAEQFRLHPTWGSLLNFAPPFFLVYLVAWPWLPFPGRWLLLLYGLGVSAGGWWTPGAPWKRRLVLPFLILATHVFYGLGFWRGCFTRLKTGQSRRPVEVSLERISLA